MNPWKNFQGLAGWMMRITILLFIFAGFFPAFMRFDVHNLHFFIALGFVIFGVMLFVGGFLSKQTLTVVSALVLFILSVLHAYWSFNGITGAFTQWLLMVSVTFYFITHGNK